MATITFDVDKFRAQFPYFADPAVWTDEYLQSCWDLATDFISTADCPCRNLNGASLTLALNLMTAHLAFLLAPQGEGESGGTTGGVVTNASIGAVSVGIMAPPVKDMWQYWLAQTPYGQQLLALLQVKAVGGFYVGGLPERVAFRKVGGTFR